MGRPCGGPWGHPQSPPQAPIGAPGQVGLCGRHKGSKEGRPRQHPEHHFPGTSSQQHPFSPHSHLLPLEDLVPGNLQPGPCLQPPIQTCLPVSAQCQGPRWNHPVSGPQPWGAGAEAYKVTQRASVGGLANRAQVLERQSAWTLDWGCWTVSQGKAGSQGWF